MKTLTTISSSILFGAVVMGCGQDGILLAEILASSRNPGPPVDEPEEPSASPTPPDPSPADVERAEIEAFLFDRCGACHSLGVDAGGLTDIEDIDALIERGLIIPGNPDDSAIVARIETGSMPPAFIDERVTDEELARLRAFVSSLPDPNEELLSETLTRYCGDCHIAAEQDAAGFFGDIDALVERGLIVPGNREESLIYLRMYNGSMPPAFIRDNRPSPEEVQSVGEAIDAL